MEPLSMASLEAEADTFDAAVLSSSAIDRFCSSTAWGLSAAEALMPPGEPVLRRVGSGYLAFSRRTHPIGPVLEPLEAAWGLGCPVVGPDEATLAAALAELAAGRPGRVIVVCGLRPGSTRLAAIAGALGRGRSAHDLGLGPITRRYVASLEGGLAGFLSRRSPQHRRALLKAQRRAQAHGVTFEAMPPEAPTVQAYARLLAVDARTWKGREGVGIAGSGLEGFYRRMLPRLARRRALRLGFARLNGEDVAYILGGILGDTYRGLQFGYAAQHAGLSLGSLCQLWQIDRLADEGIARYDLGAEVDYKQRWGEVADDTVALLAHPR